MTFPTAGATLKALHAKTSSARELLEASISRIERHDGEINAVVVRDFERARADAIAADAALARGERRPLLGLPITVKESFNVAGLPTTWGLAAAQGRAAAQDAIAVQRLRQAGAVILGKTNVATMLADWQSFNPVYGVTRNPWDLSRTPGGSSGGSAAALAAGYVSLELGSDFCGSLRVPAHCCGVFAHKPSQPLVPLRGQAPPGVPMLSVGFDPDLVVAGPMARSAADLKLALDVLAGPDDALATAYRLALPAARHERLRDFRVLVLDTHPLLPISRETAGALQAFVDRLAGTGCELASHSPLLPDLGLIAQTFAPLFLSTLGADMEPGLYRQLDQEARGLPAEASGPDALELRSLVLSHRDWLAAHRVRIRLMHEWRQLFQRWDVVVTPVLPTPAFAHDHTDMLSRRIAFDDQALRYNQLGAWMALPTLAGLPATAMPIAIGRGAASGLPIGVQAIGPFLEDLTPIRFAELCEREFGGFEAPPGFA